MRALEGLLVIAIEQAVAAPLCTLRLADGGARVIKIEREGGDTARHYDAAVHGTSAYFAWLNRGKESAVLDIKAPADRALLETMLGHADVLIQNLAPGAAARLGLDAASATARHPRLIAVDICGYGQDTDARDMRAYDMLVQAEFGLASITGTPDAMARVGVSVTDIATGMNAHAAILEALIARVRTGQGQAIEIAMFDAMADWMAVPLLHLEHLGRETGRHGLAHAAIQPYAAYPCADGDIVIAIQSPAEWVRLCERVLSQPALATDPRFADNPARVEHRDALAAIISADFRQYPRAAVIARLDAAQIAWGRVSSLPDVLAHPALRHTTASVPGGSFTLPRPAGRTGDLPIAVPAFGADTAAIRQEFAGMTADIISDRLLAEFTATLGPHLRIPPAGEAPLGLHWCLSPPTAATADLGPDGHPPRAHPVSTTDFPRRMWVGGSLSLAAPLRPGQRVTRTTTLLPVESKAGNTGNWVLSGADHRFETDGERLLTEHQDIAFRPASAASPPPPRTTPLPPGDLSWDIPTPPTLLFRYSALTFNSHRIHYDQPYATSVEGYAGLVVHGPLQATILLNLAATLLGRAPAHFAYRATAPLTAGHMIAIGRHTGNGLAVSMFAPNGTETMHASAT